MSRTSLTFSTTIIPTILKTMFTVLDVQVALERKELPSLYLPPRVSLYSYCFIRLTLIFG